MPSTVVRTIPLEEFIGQEKLIEILQHEIAGSLIAHTALPNMLLYGRPGLGKDTLVHSIAAERGVHVHKCVGGSFNEDVISQWCDAIPGKGYQAGSGRVIDRKAIRPDILWIDECEQVALKLWESVHGLLEPNSDGIRTFMGKIPGSRRKQNSWFPESSWIFTTNYAGKFRKRGEALINRIGLKWMLEPYTVPELIRIVEQHSKKLGVFVGRHAASQIAHRSMGTPRTAVLLLQRCINSLTVRLGRRPTSADHMPIDVVERVFALAGVDDIGLDQTCRDYLKVLADDEQGKLGIESIASTMGIDRDTIVMDIEPFLMRLGFVRIVAGGRQITPEGIARIGGSNVVLHDRRITQTTPQEYADEQD